MNTQFLEAFFVDSIQHPNFFNGRILTATDLRDEQRANLRRSQYLGQALGSGVVSGLQVTINSADNSALEITGGLAINPKGETLALPVAQTTLKLTITNQLIASSSSPFVPCRPPAATTSTGLITTNYYLLAIASATKFSDTGSAPHSSLGTSNNRCTSRYEEIGVQFKLVPLTETDFVNPIPATALDNRSRLAHVCFGTNQLRAIAAQPNNDQRLTYGLVDALYEDQRLTECDVPLAVFQFQSNTLRFVDMWAVRRIAQPGIYTDTYLNDPLSYFVSPRRVNEAVSFFLQFKDHLEDLRTDSSITPVTLAAKDYFEYLPAAGYLPISTLRRRRGFQIDQFFGDSIPTQVLEPNELRSLFHQSLFEEPIRLGIDAVDIYRVKGASPSYPYRIFVRRPVITILPEAEEEPDSPTSVASGDLFVKVLSLEGEDIPTRLIKSVQATNTETNQTYIGRRGQNSLSKSLQKRYASFVNSSKIKVANKYISERSGRPVSSIDDFFGAKIPDQGFYFFDNLPKGKYTVLANPTQLLSFGVSDSVVVLANINNFISVVIRDIPIIRDRPINREFRVRAPDNYTTPGGLILEGFLFDSSWSDYYPDWESDLPDLESGIVDPPPEDWIHLQDVIVGIQLEEIFGAQERLDPRVATEGAVIYIRNNYNPSQPGETVSAFVQTQDGSRFPAIPLAADNALDKPASVDRTEIPDFDRATVNRLQSLGLVGIDAFASAPSNLVAAVLGQSVEYSTSLILEAQKTLQDDFRYGYLGYPGINKEQSDRLQEQFESKVDLANVDLDNESARERLFSALGIDVNSEIENTFPTRFLADVSNTVLRISFDLEGTSIDRAGLAALKEIGVSTNAIFRERATTEEGYDQLKEALDVSDATLNRYLDEATLNIIKGELLSEPEKSVGTLVGIPADLKQAISGVGISSAKELANKNPAELAILLSISEDESVELINTAKSFGSKAHLTLIMGILGTENIDTVTENLIEADLSNIGEISRVDSAILETAGLDATTARKVIELSGRLLSDSNIFNRAGFRRF